MNGTAIADILAAGHCCHDTLLPPDGSKHEALGGSVVYIASVLEPLGADLAVITKVGDDFRYPDRVRFETPRAGGALTTACVDDSSKGARESSFPAVCEPIRPEDIRRRAEIAVACPIAGELPPETLMAIRRSSIVLLCDVQGLIRDIGPDGTVRHRPLAETAFAPLLPAIDFLKADEQEAESLDIGSLSWTLTLLITKQERGCSIVRRGKSVDIPGFPVEAVDGTGAGDSFMAGLAYALLKERPIEDAARFANYCGSLAVRSIGVPELSPKDFKEAP